jgi:hypothetical protein
VGAGENGLNISTSRRRTLLALAAFGVAWSLVLKMTGGLAFETQWGLISSRNALRPLVAGVGLLVWYVVAWRHHWRTDLGFFRHLGFLRHLATPQALGGLATLTALVAGLGWGATLAAGPDPSGYVSQAAMFARGELTVEAPRWAQSGAWDDAAFTASPVGWHPTYQTHILAPTYSPGLPLIMAAVQKAAGPDAVFVIVPVLGGLLVCSAYLLGTRLGGAWAGAIAAVLVVSSPTFLALQLQVMSDVPVAAFWTVSVVAGLHGHAGLAGAAAGLAVLTRPNLVPLTAVPFVLIVWSGWRMRSVLAFGAPVGIACAIVAALNWRYHGSPLLSGYGPLNRLYSLANIGPNLVQYGRWFVELHTPLGLLGFAAAFVSGVDRWRIALVTLAIPLALLAFYAPFAVFQSWEWAYTRFLLPAYPALFAGLGIVASTIVAWSQKRRLAATAVALILAVIAVRGWTLAIDAGVFMQRAGEARYAHAVEYARRLPQRSILFSNAHSGTLHLYARRDVLRFEAIRRTEIDIATTHLRRQGYALFFIGDEFEIDQFRTLFAGTRTAASLPPKPRARFGGVVVYDINP